eukprot:Rhum_TRINITY_DN14599_c27_g1::Rhum_TRINITY_DN14599_c27_g1_i1::g.102198::m.102198
MRSRNHRQRVLGDVEAVLGALGRDGGEAVLQVRGVEVRRVEVHARVVVLRHLGRDHARHDVTARQLAVRVVVLREGVSVLVDQATTDAPHSLRHKEAALTRDVQRRRVELHVLHVLQLRARAVRHGEPVAPRSLRVAGVGVQVTESARCQHGGLGGDGEALTGGVVHHNRTDAAVVVLKQVHSRGVRHQGHPLVEGRGGQHRLGDRSPRLVLVVDDAGTVVRRLEAQEQVLRLVAAVERDFGVVDQDLLDPPGSLRRKHVHCASLTHARAGVGHVGGEELRRVVRRPVDDAALRPVAVAVVRVLRRREHRHVEALLGSAEGNGAARNAAAHDEHIRGLVHLRHVVAGRHSLHRTGAADRREHPSRSLRRHTRVCVCVYNINEVQIL